MRDSAKCEVCGKICEKGNIDQPVRWTWISCQYDDDKLTSSIYMYLCPVCTKKTSHKLWKLVNDKINKDIAQRKKWDEEDQKRIDDWKALMAATKAVVDVVNKDALNAESRKAMRELTKRFKARTMESER